MSNWKDDFIRDIYELYYAPPMAAAPVAAEDKVYVCTHLSKILKLYSENIKELEL